MRARNLSLVGSSVGLLLIAGGCRGIVGVEDAVLVQDAGASQGGSNQAGAGQGGSNEGGSNQGGTGQGGTSQGGGNQGGSHQGGAGGSDCQAPDTLCGDACIDTQNDRANCGSCGNACSSSQVCRASDCVDCGAGEEVCPSGCASVLDDAANCGWCEHKCTLGMCSQGICAAEELASASGPPSTLTASSEGIWWVVPSTNPPNAVVQGLKGPGVPQTLVDGAGVAAKALTLDAYTSELVWASSNDLTKWSLLATPKDTPGLWTVVDDIGEEPFQTVSRLGYVYYSNPTQGLVSKVFVGNSPASSEVIKSGLTNPKGLALGSDNSLFVADKTQVLKLDLGVPESGTEAAKNQGGVTFVAVTTDRLVWYDEPNQTIRTRRLDGQEDVQGVTVYGGVAGVVGFVVSGDLLYYYAVDGASGKPGIYVLPVKPDAGPMPLAYTSDVTALTVHEGFIVWSTSNALIRSVPR